jgi:hypothetical protein
MTMPVALFIHSNQINVGSDPIGIVGGLNTYTYVGEINYTDLSWIINLYDRWKYSCSILVSLRC